MLYVAKQPVTICASIAMLGCHVGRMGILT